MLQSELHQISNLLGMDELSSQNGAMFVTQLWQYTFNKLKCFLFIHMNASFKTVYANLSVSGQSTIGYLPKK